MVILTQLLMAAETSDRSEEVPLGLFILILSRQFKIHVSVPFNQFLFSHCEENEKEAQFQCRRERFVIMRVISVDEFFFFFFC